MILRELILVRFPLSLQPSLSSPYEAMVSPLESHSHVHMPHVACFSSALSLTLLGSAVLKKRCLPAAT